MKVVFFSLLIGGIVNEKGRNDHIINHIINHDNDRSIFNRNTGFRRNITAIR